MVPGIAHTILLFLEIIVMLVYSHIKHWNSLQNSIKQITNLAQFKKAIKKHLMDQAIRT